MPLTRYSDEFFTYVSYTPQRIAPIYCRSSDDGSLVSFDPFKEHIFMDPDPRYFHATFPGITTLLDKAVENGTITGYKYFNDGAIKFNPFSRILNIRYTTYLPVYTPENARKVLSLNQSIETFLKNVPPGHKDALTTSDILFSTRLSFRQCSRNGKCEYIPTIDKGMDDEHKKPITSVLAEQGRASAWFKSLSQGLSVVPSKTSSITSTLAAARDVVRHSTSSRPSPPTSTKVPASRPVPISVSVPSTSTTRISKIPAPANVLTKRVPAHTKPSIKLENKSHPHTSARISYPRKTIWVSKLSLTLEKERATFSRASKKK